MHAFACESNRCSIFVSVFTRESINKKFAPTNKHAHQDKGIFYYILNRNHANKNRILFGNIRHEINDQDQFY
jgi:hypothetical protein